MNNVLLQQTGGFPLETDTLDFMQTAYKSLQAMAAIGGENIVLKGCVKNGANVGDGFIVINGEVLEFRGGLEQTHILILSESATRPFENGQTKEVFVTRYATFGSGLNAIAWDTIKRLKPLEAFRNMPTETTNDFNVDDVTKLATAKALKLLNDKVDKILPANIITIWSGSIPNIPVGWALCDGQEGRPDLRDKFVLGAGNLYAVGDTGGEEKHTLTIEEMPDHNHSVAGAMRNGVAGSGFGSGSNVFNNSPFNTSSKGGNQAHNNMPPYYALAYIIKL